MNLSAAVPYSSSQNQKSLYPSLHICIASARRNIRKSTLGPLTYITGMYHQRSAWTNIHNGCEGQLVITDEFDSDLNYNQTGIKNFQDDMDEWSTMLVKESRI